MKAFQKFITLIIIACCMMSCYSVKLAAPANKSVVLATATEPLPVKQRVTNWYALYGSIPVSKRGKTDRIIETLQLTKVRMETRLSVGNMILNVLLNALLPTTLVTNTTIIEGDIKRNESERGN